MKNFIFFNLLDIIKQTKVIIVDINVIMGLSVTNVLKEIKNVVYIMENKKDFAKALLLDFSELEKLNNPLNKYLNISTNTSAKK